MIRMYHSLVLINWSHVAVLLDMKSLMKIARHERKRDRESPRVFPSLAVYFAFVLSYLVTLE